MAESSGGRAVIVVLADDFSGAAEIAGAAIQHGLSAEVRIDHALKLAGGQMTARDVPTCDVIVVDTNTRSGPPEAAAAAVSGVARELLEIKPDWIYKKIDSVLRGAIMVEIHALRNSLGFQRCLLVNANPRKNRIVVQGQLWVDGHPLHRTHFADDPEHPCRSSSVVELLRSENARVRVLNSPLDLTESTATSFGRSQPASGFAEVCVANCKSSDDLSGYAQQVTADTLAVGAAEFFESLLEARGCLRRATESKLVCLPGTLIVRGTSTQEQARPAGSDAPSAPAIVTSESRQATADAVCGQLKQSGRAVLAIRAVDRRAPASVSVDEPTSLADRLHAELVDTVSLIAAQCPPRQLWIEGGRTASSVVRSLGWKRLVAEECYADGVVGLRATEPSAPMLVVKPGSYRWPDPL